ncbi:MAG: hypothetical protein PHG31_05810 [Candidatus Omnitrophica bacterium]|nr:hypothetical protein [Candidatus Omnitrophota bacterium]
MNDLKEDLEKKTIHFSKYQTTISTGEVFYRFVDKGDDPLRPTGRESRFVSEPDNLCFEEYRRVYYNNEFERMPSLATGGFAMTNTFSIAAKEIQEPQNKDWWMLKLTRNFVAIDLRLLCEDKRIPFDKAKE